MKIGIDMDDTICSTSETITEYQNKFIKEKNINIDTLWNNNKYKEEFLNKYLKDIYMKVKIKDNCIKVLNELSKNHELYIITARTKNYVNNIIDVIEIYLEKNNIKVDGIFINGKDKVDICIKNKIDVMIDDSYYNYDKLISNGIVAILFDENNYYSNIKNRINNWEEISKIINK